jgi:putative hydrolase of HD superfamily
MDLIHKFFEAANMQRWNDHIRPVELTELDKQAHKMVLAWVLARFEEREKGTPIDWTKIIEGGIFEFLQRVVLTDLKPPVFHRISKEKRDEMNSFVLRELNENVPNMDPSFLERFKDYFEDQDAESIERRVLKAAHYLATNWEFKMIYAANPTMYGIDDTRKNIEMQIEDHYDLIGVQRILLEKKSFGFVEFCGQLRFQQRWARSPRIPKTSVLGHMLMVAIMSYLCSAEIGACPRRIYNNYFTSLFHDLPEVLTKDIITPVKKNVGGLDRILVDYEKQEVEEKLLPLIPSQWRKDFEYLLWGPWRNRIIEGGTVKVIEEDEIPSRYNKDAFQPVDGVLLKACDNLAAYIEASTSVRYGIRSKTLEVGMERLGETLRDRNVYGIDFERLVEDFEAMRI